MADNNDNKKKVKPSAIIAGIIPGLILLVIGIIGIIYGFSVFFK